MNKRVYSKRPNGLHQAYFYYQPVVVNWYNLRVEGKKQLSAAAQIKLEWIIFYHTLEKEDASKTARHFGISRKTFHEKESQISQNLIGKQMALIQQT